MRTFLNVADPDALEDVPAAEEDDGAPDVLFTSLVGSKGLSAEHVFIVGMNNNHFPGCGHRRRDLQLDRRA